MHFCPEDLNVAFQRDEYFKQKTFDRVQLRAGACTSAYNGLVAPVLRALWLQSDWGENGLRPAEIMELVCSPRAALLAGVNSVNSRSFFSQTLSLPPLFQEVDSLRWMMDV